MGGAGVADGLLAYAKTVCGAISFLKTSRPRVPQPPNIASGISSSASARKWDRQAWKGRRRHPASANSHFRHPGADPDTSN